MVSFSFDNFFFFLNTVSLLIYTWVFFFKLNTNANKNNKHQTNISVVKQNPNCGLAGFYLIVFLLNITFVFLSKFEQNNVMFNHFYINNFAVSVLNSFLLVGFIFYVLIYCVVRRKNFFKNIDYLFSIINLMLVMPYLFFVNTTFTFLFVLEFVSCLLFYNIISSKIWFKNPSPTTIKNNIPQTYINMIFFQYWVTFFSTIFIIYFYIDVFSIYGTSDWFIMQFLTKINFSGGVDSHKLRILVLVLIISVLFKLGITPFHLFKVEVYKGIPFISIFFYTTFYFAIFFLFFLFVLGDYLLFYSYLYIYLLTVVLFIGTIYITSLIFDVGYIKVFFTYSTVINTVGLLIVFFSNI